jgi:hypothetical protein
MKLGDRVKSSEPLSRVVEIPDPALNEKLVPMNDNSEPTSLSREYFEAGSIVSQLDYIEPRKGIRSGLIVVVALCLAALATFIMLSI